MESSQDNIVSSPVDARIAKDIKTLRVTTIIACVLVFSTPICFYLCRVSLDWVWPTILFPFFGLPLLACCWSLHANAEKRHAKMREMYPVLEQFKAMRAAERKAALESGKPRILWGPTLFKWGKWWVIGCWTVYGIVAIGLILGRL
jgi:uncharacterized membrane protein